ncbi:hypothetical protein ACFO5Q_05230 [Kordiimonas lipolytica]|uniref:Hemolysin-type calcium-binding repeat-containing protein n=1 Tax=Kordiimonas lipolytica TaxID=1662421 RepID=A0ABV8U7Q7_9PROT|nr:calcium-binding protein [Kordiimonas lipolytica]
MPGLTANGNEFTANTYTSVGQVRPEIASLEGGGYVVVWTNFSAAYDGDGYGLAGQVFDSDGNPVGAEFTVNTEFEDNQDNVAVTGLPGGGFIVTWGSNDLDVDGDNAAVSGQIFDASGNKVGGEFAVNTEVEGFQLTPDVTSLAGGGFVVTWESTDPDVDGDGYGIAGQIFDAAGNKVGSEFVVNTEAEGTQEKAVVAGLSGGGFVIAWESGDPDVDGDSSGIAAQIFDASGNPVGGEFTVNTVSQGAQDEPDIAGLTNGGFVITWRNGATDADGDLNAVSARIFDASGTPKGDEFIVNTLTSSVQTQPSVTAVSKGGFVISWTQNAAGGDGDGTSIAAQLFDANGNKVGDETTINERVASAQNHSAVTYLSGDDVAFTWVSSDPAVDGDSSGIAARAFSFSLPSTPDHSEQPTSSLDTTTATDGNDTLEFGVDDDTVAAGSGDDYVDGGQGDDTVSGGAGNDTIEGGDGADLILGGAGDDRIYATNIANENGDVSGNIVWAGAGDDVVYGGLGNDTLGGGTEADSIEGGRGADLIYGGEGNDTLDGGSGADTLWGGAGDDVLTGGSGADVFIFGAVSGNDTITDFDLGDDVLLVSFAGITDLAGLQAASAEQSVDGQDGVLITLGEGESIFIIGLQLDDLASVTLG